MSDTSARSVLGLAGPDGTGEAGSLRGAGLVNYPTEWWHWSYGDRYWALMTGARAALYGPVAADSVAR